jgi:hypothetical protein
MARGRLIDARLKNSLYHVCEHYVKLNYVDETTLPQLAPSRRTPYSSESCGSRPFREELTDRFNVVQERRAESRQNYEMLKELLKDEDFRRLTGKVLEMQTRLKKSAAT